MSTVSPLSAQEPPKKGMPEGLRKVVVASMAGTVVEWYEFFVYATAATLVFGHVFFRDTGNPLDGVIAALLTYAVGFVARPLGGLVFGHYGDRYGRKKLLQVSLLIMGISTFLMGALPTFQQVGYLAPTLLVLMRFAQGFALGGEWGGAVLLVAEHSPAHRRGFWSSFPQAGVPLGNLLATFVLLILSSTLSEQAFLSWGWRVAFFLSAVIVFVGLYVRRQVEDAPIFKAAQAAEEHAKRSRFTALEVLRRRPRQVLVAMGARVAENIMYYLVVTFSITYLKIRWEMDTSTILLLVLVAHVVHLVIVPTWGALADRIGRRPVYLAGSVLCGFYGFVAFPLMDTQQDWVILFAISLGLVIHGLMYAPQPALMAEMFPTRMRYSGVSLGYQVTSIFAGSLAPVIAAALLNAYGSATPVAWYLAAAAAVTTVALLFAKETKGKALEDVDDEFETAESVRLGAAAGL